MLKRFAVSNFRGFASEIELKLDGASDYQFNTNLVSEGFVKNALVYGKNGSGKTSLLRAMAHIVPVLTDLFFSPTLVSNMDCGNSDSDPTGLAIFTYDLFVEGEEIIYCFAKDRTGLQYEKVFSQGELVLSTEGGKRYVNEAFFPELKQTAWANFYDGRISLVKYLGRSGIKMEHGTLLKIIGFAETFLLVRSVIDGNEFAGFTTQTGSMVLPLLEPKNLKEFEEFLHNCGVNYHLQVEKTQDPMTPNLKVVFQKEKRNFFDVASSGTRYLMLVFYWIKKIGDQVSLLCIDEFDAYFHDDCARFVFELLAKTKCQVILTTHKTALMINHVARPDVLFNLENGSISSFSSLAGDRELREAHNMEKLYRSGAFSRQ